MKCRVEGCGRDARYQAAQLCQKHYFRQRRNGHTDLLLDRKRAELGYSRVYRVVMPGKGYVRVHEPNHPLAGADGTVSEHRKIVFDRYGYSLPPCELCGKPMNWSGDIHIDHRDEDVSNNHPDNLRPLCRPCNTFRNYPSRHTFKNAVLLAFAGETKTAAEWGRDPRIKVSGHQIIMRKRAGMSDFDALFSEKKTHNGKLYVDSRPRKTQAKHERKNAVAATIDGVTMTAMEWSRYPGCAVCDATIRQRIKAGWPPVAAVFGGPKVRREECQAIEAEYRQKLKALMADREEVAA